MNGYNELKEFCDREAEKKIPKEDIPFYRREIKAAKRFYDNGRNLYNELKSKKPNNKYIIPFLLGITDSYTKDKIDLIQVKDGASGGKINATLYRNI